MSMFSGAAGMGYSYSENYSATEKFDSVVLAGSKPSGVNSSTCVFWSAVALGSLVRGSPIESVSYRVTVAFWPRGYHDGEAFGSILFFCGGGWYEPACS